MTRYQYCVWYIKLWRKRWLLVIPYWAFSGWVGSLDREDQYYKHTFKHSWSEAHGWAHWKMEWYYSSEEMDERFK